MAFQITRFANISQARALEPGGTFTMGAVNSSLYTGAIDYVNLPSNAVTYWTLPLTCTFTTFILSSFRADGHFLSVDCSGNFNYTRVWE